MSSSGYPIHELLKQSETTLGKLIDQARAIEKLNNLFAQVLDLELIPHCRVGCYHNGVLTLFTDTAAWATKLRYQVPIILSKLRTFPQWAGLRSIQVKIETFSQAVCESAQHIPYTPPTLSPASASHLESLANTLKNHPGTEALISSLERLAKHKK